MATSIPVQFDSNGATLQGDLFVPPTWSPGTRLPAVLVSGSWTTVKEQMAGLYARRLADAGYVALAFDFTHWGASDGQPRQLESTQQKIRDLTHAAAFLGTRAEVDPDAVGALAICASAGYLAHAVAGGAAVRSIALIAAWLHDAGTVTGIYGGEAGVQRRVAAARAALEAERTTGQIAYVPAYDPANPDAAMFFPLDYYASPARGAVPQWTNRFAVASWEEWLTFDALSAAAGIHVPLLVVHADDAALPDNARRFFGAARGPKHLLWTTGAQTDFYDREPQVGLAVDVAVAHFRRTLGTPAGAGSIADRLAITDAISGLLSAIDRLDWPGVRARLAEEIRTDYTSLFGGAPASQPATGLVNAWRALLPGFDGTQHLTGPVLADVAGDRARASCAVTAVHRLAAEHWTVSGHYDVELQREANGWTIASLTYRHLFTAGDASLPAKAQARAGAAAGLR